MTDALSRVARLRTRAEECQRIARHLQSEPEMAAKYEELARGYERLAIEAEREALVGAGSRDQEPSRASNKHISVSYRQQETFQTGQVVELVHGRGMAPRGSYQIVRVLPLETAEQRYLVRSLHEQHERVVWEHELRLVRKA